jgi:hypothetical protein
MPPLYTFFLCDRFGRAGGTCNAEYGCVIAGAKTIAPSH